MIPPLLALFSWPVVTWVLFKKYRAPIAMLAALIGGYLLLPTSVSFDLPLLPALAKSTIPVLSVLAVVALLKIAPEPSIGGRKFTTHSNLANGLLLLMLIGPFFTVMTNLDALRYGPTVIQPLRMYDAFSNTLTAIMTLLPFLVGYRFLGSPQENRSILYVLMVAALCYSVLALYEIRMSPQLNRIFYGFFPHDWQQHMRNGGFRPLVFLKHGLRLALFLAIAVLATLALMRASEGKQRNKLLWMAVYLMVVLVLSKSLGALITAVVLGTAILFCNIRMQLIVAAVVAGIVMTYPILRGAGLVPTQAILAQFENINPERAQSLGVRFKHEDALLTKAQERPLFGWSAAYKRNRVFNDRGKDVSITDGYWVIIIGSGGWLRYVATFGLLGLPIIFMALRSRKLQVGQETAGLCMVMAANLFDLLPNSGMTPITWLLCGSLWARLVYVNVPSDDRAEAAEPENANAIRYARPRELHQRPKRSRAPAWSSASTERLPNARKTQPEPHIAPQKTEPKLPYSRSASTKTRKT